ncbi:hypothetical protein [Burkholderia multivorans]|uniref:hypothetical protein n=1 Tax=Burkholderia multivorans TaxID=87883 RepID=UPI002097403C|nr:hypothetical protein [Burkholderia multivorans]MCO7336037.1 hypothetical protein [Burkholderia multivorans]HDR9337688.1 hypothetical protein [Burkholderia multivorans]
MNEIKSARDTFEAWAKGWWFDECYEPCCSSDAKDAAWCAWEERSILVDDMALALEMIAAEDDAGTVMIPSALRLTIDAALIKADRKEAPVPVRHFTINGGAL